MDRRTFVTAASTALVLGSAPSAGVAAPPPPQPAISLQSNFWVNLHHRLYRQAGARAAVRAGERLSRLAPQIYAELEALRPADRGAWDAALATYERGYIARDFIFDDALESILEKLRDLSNTSPRALHAVQLPAPLASALATSAPIYARTYWPTDNSANRHWIAAVKPALTRFGSAISARMATVYRTPWRSVPYRDDVVRYANWAEAYTVDTRTCVSCVIGSASAGNAGRGALETIYHEASHSLVFPDYGRVADVISASSKELGRQPPDGFWHAVIFFTAGRLCQERYAAAGEPPYRMFADEANLWDGAWSSYRTALANHWDAHLAGTVSLETALSRCIADISA